MRKSAIRAGLETLYFTGTHRLARSFLAGAGAILTLHHVRPPRDDGFQPNRGLEVTPDFLDEAVSALKDADVDIVSIDEAHRRLTDGVSERRFVVLTFDDGYRDTLENAWPILERHEAPFTIYAVSDFAEGIGLLWWEALEQAIRQSATIEVELDQPHRFDCTTAQGKSEAFCTIYRWLRERKRDAELRRVVGEIAAQAGVDTAAQCRAECLDWNALAGLAEQPLVTIGAHSVSHPFLAKIDAEAVRSEMVESRRRIEERLGIRPEHFAYPVGAPDAAGRREFRIAAEVGFKTAVTTRPGVLFPDHRRHLTALPRISVNGEFQRLRFLDVLLSGAATALLNGFRRIDAA